MFGGRGANKTPTYDPCVDDSPLACGRWAFKMASDIWGMHNICITGDSAGGNLALAVVLSAQGRGYMEGEEPIYPAMYSADGMTMLRPAGLLLNSPWVDLRRMAYYSNAPAGPWPAGQWPTGPPGAMMAPPGSKAMPPGPPVCTPPAPETFTCCGLSLVPMGCTPSSSCCAPMPAPMPCPPMPMPCPPKPVPPPMVLNEGLGYWNESIARNNQLHYAWARHGGVSDDPPYSTPERRLTPVPSSCPRRGQVRAGRRR